MGARSPEGEWPAEAAPLVDWLEARIRPGRELGAQRPPLCAATTGRAGAISSDDTDRCRAVHRRAGRSTHGDPLLLWRRASTAPGPWRWPTPSATTVAPGRSPGQRRRHPVPLARRRPRAPAGPDAKLGPEEARERLLIELPNSAVFGAHFRMNAARALLLPARAWRRPPHALLAATPARQDLLAMPRAAMTTFPIVAETYRDCLRDVLDLESTCCEVLARIQRGEIRVIVEPRRWCPHPWRRPAVRVCRHQPL